MKTYIVYLRTSTTKQELSFDAQMNIINNFIQADDVILNTFSEQESGSKKNRTVLDQAVLLCQQTKATLLCAKLDRLSRSVSFIANLYDEGKIDIIIADMPTANSFVINVLASVAQQELESIRSRTKGALNVIKTNIERDGFHISKAGNKITKLGSATPITEENRLLGQKAIQDKVSSNPNLIKAKAFAVALKNAGNNLTEITDQLNKNGFKTSRGATFHLMSTSRLFK